MPLKNITKHTRNVQDGKRVIYNNIPYENAGVELRALTTMYLLSVKLNLSHVIVITLPLFYSPLDNPRCCSQFVNLIHSLSEHLLSSKIVGSSGGFLSVLGQAIQSYSLLVSSGERRDLHLDYKFILTLVR